LKRRITIIVRTILNPVTNNLSLRSAIDALRLPLKKMIMMRLYYLLKNPSKMDKLTKEIRSSFQKETEIDFESTKRLTYQAAVLEESLRIFPPRKRHDCKYPTGSVF
jgi:hypothetical protein